MSSALCEWFGKPSDDLPNQEMNQYKTVYGQNVSSS